MRRDPGLTQAELRVLRDYLRPRKSWPWPAPSHRIRLSERMWSMLLSYDKMTSGKRRVVRDWLRSHLLPNLKKNLYPAPKALTA